MGERDTSFDVDGLGEALVVCDLCCPVKEMLRLVTGEGLRECLVMRIVRVS